MGCFLACFGSSKDRKRRKPANKVLPRDQRHGSYEPLKPTVSLKQESLEIPISPVSELGDKPEEQLSFSTRKKVTFDLNVRTYEEVSTREATNYSSESDEEKERGKKEQKRTKASQSLSLSEDDSNKSSMGSFPSNHRYQSCRNSDDEDEGIESEESDDLDDDDDYDDEGDYDDDDYDPRGREEESSESFFSLPTESQTRVSATTLYEKEVNSPVPICGSPDRELKTLRLNKNARDRSQYVHSVLNPVENLTQWKTVKARTTSPLKLQKENANLELEPQIPFSSEPTFKLSPFKSNPNFNHSKPPKQEIAVDSSLSNWLVSTESTPTTKTSTITVTTESSERSKSQRSNSPRSQEDRPILGALTIEELRQFSVSSSPRRPRSRSPEEMPILGTVGSYWNHTGQAVDSSSGSSSKGIPNATSKYREDNRVNWHLTPFETRLERALNRGSAEAYSSYPPSVC